MSLDRRDDNGFTLVEIVVAIVLVGVLSAVVVVGVGRLTERGSSAACSASADAARTASFGYFATFASHPTTLTALTSGGKPLLELPRGVTVDGSGTVVAGSGWWMTMSGGGGVAPVFTCAASAPTSTTSATTTSVAPAQDPVPAEGYVDDSPVTKGLSAHFDAAPWRSSVDADVDAAKSADALKVCGWIDRTERGVGAVARDGSCPRFGVDDTGGLVSTEGDVSMTLNVPTSADWTIVVVAGTKADGPVSIAGADGDQGFGMSADRSSAVARFELTDAKGASDVVGEVRNDDLSRSHVYMTSFSAADGVVWGLDEPGTRSASIASSAKVTIRLGAAAGTKQEVVLYREILVFDRALQPDEMQVLASHLAEKWRIG